MELVHIIPKLCLAPMVRVSCLPFRLLALRNGADYVYTEEIIDKKLIDCQRVENTRLDTIDFVSNKDNNIVLRIAKEEQNSIVCQIGSNDPVTAVKAAKLVEKDVKWIDVNMGCPEYFSVHAGMGAGLLKTPEVAKSVLNALNREISVPISCKIRLLPKLNDCIDFMKLMQTTGIHLIGIHARTREEMSRGFAHWSVVREAKRNADINIPIYASGDCYSPNDAFEMKLYTNCDGILIARGALHNPFIFNDIKKSWKSISKNTTNRTVNSSENEIYFENKRHINEFNLENLIIDEEINDSNLQETKSKNQIKKNCKEVIK